MRSERLARRGSDCRGLEGQGKACEFGFKCSGKRSWGLRSSRCHLSFCASVFLSCRKEIVILPHWEVPVEVRGMGGEPLCQASSSTKCGAARSVLLVVWFGASDLGCWSLSLLVCKMGLIRKGPQLRG